MFPAIRYIPLEYVSLLVEICKTRTMAVNLPNSNGHIRCWAWIILAWLVRDHVCMCLGSEVKPGDTHATVSRRRRHARCAQLRHYDIPANQHIQQPVAVQIISRLGPQLLWRGLNCCWVLTYRTSVAFWATVTSNRLPYAAGLLSCLSVSDGLLWPNSWMDHDATWYGGRPWPRWHCVRWTPSSSSMV